MADEADPVSTCNCTETLTRVQNLRSDMEDYKTQVLIIHWVMAAVIAILVVCVVILLFLLRKLSKLVTALDPMSKYKKVGPSLYIKRPRRKTTSISSSFKHFNAGIDNNIYLEPDDAQANNNDTLKKSEDVGTLDKNFFTTSNFSFQNPLSNRNAALEQENGLNKRKISDSEAMEAVDKLDKVIY